jgi:hypothetical protein
MIRPAEAGPLLLARVSTLHPDANLHEPPPPSAGKGRPRVKGPARPQPRPAAATARRRRLTVGLRAAPCRFGLYAVVAARSHALPPAKRSGSVAGPGMSGATFPDALTAVRRWRWADAVSPQAGDSRAGEKRPGPRRELLLTALAPAAQPVTNPQQSSLARLVQF